MFTSIGNMHQESLENKIQSTIILLESVQKSDGLIKEQQLYMIFTKLILFWEIPLSAGRRVHNRAFVCRQNYTKYVPSLLADCVHI